MESLDAANGFMYTSDDSRYVACERAVHQVTHTLERLVQVWKVRFALFPAHSLHVINDEQYSPS